MGLERTNRAQLERSLRGAEEDAARRVRGGIGRLCRQRPPRRWGLRYGSRCGRPPRLEGALQTPTPRWGKARLTMKNLAFLKFSQPATSYQALTELKALAGEAAIDIH